MSAVQLVPICGSSFYCAGKYSVGVYVDKPSKTAILIDSGPDERIARAIDRELVRRGFRVGAILHTHGHQSSCGGDRYFAAQYPAIKIYATVSTLAEMTHPAPDSLTDEGLALYGAHREQAYVTDMMNEQAEVSVGGIAFRVIPLPGHVAGMVGIASPDNVLYAGDALFGEKVLRRQRFLLYMNIGEAKRSFRKLTEMRPHAYVLYHGGVYRDVAALVDRHIERMEQMLTFVESRMKTHPVTNETLIRDMMAHFGLEDDLESYALAARMVRACATELLGLERMTAAVERGALVFSRPERYADLSSRQ